MKTNRKKKIVCPYTNTKTELDSQDPILTAGQFVYEVETGVLKIGNGTNRWSELSDFLSETTKAKSYANYEALVTEFNSLDSNVYKIGQNMYIETLEVPDLWVYKVEETSIPYTYVDDTTFLGALNENGYVQIGYYKVSMLETQKVDISNKVDKVEGKGLSTNDYTDEEKSKLGGLSNYDDTAIQGSVSSLAENKMNKSNPVGTGYFSFNRKPETDIGNYSLAKGYDAVALGDYSVAEGYQVTAYGDKTHIIGTSDHIAANIVTEQQIDAVVTASNKSNRYYYTDSDEDKTIQAFIDVWDHQDSSEDADQKFSLAAGVFSTVEGANCLGLAKGSHAEGNGCVAAGKAAHAEGTGSKALGHYSHSGGLETIAYGVYSFAHGFRVKANGDTAIAIGRGDGTEGFNANGHCAISIGLDSKATGKAAIAIGNNVISQKNGQIVLGSYNEPNNTSAFIVGNGTGENSRSNAHTLDNSGNAWYAGSVEATAIILTSPNGTRYQITVDNDGQLSASAINV